MTSYSAVHIIKKFTKVSKAGHAGTLDPKATGLLIICTDKATKRINEFMNLEKEYEGIFRIGAITKTFDTESEENSFTDVSDITDTQIQNVSDEFKGKILQTPPIYSAIKFKGKPLYKFARNGEDIKVMPREVEITEFDVKKISENEIWFKIVCSKGTYIRTIASDFGIKLGVGAYLKSLRRTRIGNYNLNEIHSEVSGIKFFYF